MFFFDTQYMLMVMIPTVILSGLAQFFVRSAYQKWRNVQNSSGASGVQIAQHLMRSTGLNVQLERTDRELGDHYDPTSHTVRMSPSVAQLGSVASMAIVAHELWHAQQHQEGSILIGMRSFLLPAVRFSPTVSYGLIMAGFFFNFCFILSSYS